MKALDAESACCAVVQTGFGMHTMSMPGQAAPPGTLKDGVNSCWAQPANFLVTPAIFGLSDGRLQ